MRHCPACGAPLTGHERFCPSCGTEIGLVALDPPGTRGPSSDSAVVASRPRRGLRRGLILAGALLAGSVSWQLTQRELRPDDSTPATTPTRPTTTATSAQGDPATTTTPPTQPTPPGRVELPAGLTGHLIAATSDTFIDIDLATGAVATTSLQARLSIDRVVALDNTIVGLGSDGAFTISPTDGSASTIIDGASVSYLGDDARTLLVATGAPERQQALKIIRADGQLIDVHPDAAARMLAGPFPIHDGLVVIGAGQGVGLIDPATGAGRLLGEGALVAANRDLLIRVVCQPDLHCNWIIGDYDGNQRHAIDAPTDALPGFGLATISTDGSTVFGLAFGPGQPVLRAMDLTTGAIRPVDNPSALTAFFERRFAVTSDGHWLIIRNTGGDIELISLTDPSSHTLELNLPGAIEALTVTG